MNATPPRAGTPRRFDVAVQGAGVVGQTLALLLARDRLRVALVGGPRGTDAPDVRAYALNSASRELLRSVRAWPEADANDQHASPITPVSAMQVWGDDGGELKFSANDQGSEALTWIVDVPALEQRLSDAVGFQGGIERLTETPAAALTVVCEGKRSQTREQLGLAFDVRPYAHKAVAARLRCERPHGGVARQWFAQGEVMALLPLGGAEGNSVALVWSVPAEQANLWLQSDPSVLAQAVQARSANTLGTLHMESPAQAWPLELSRAQRWITRNATGGVALAGDAAHAMHPLAGQGLNVGLADAAELARVLHEREYWRDLGDLKLLRRYERARAAEVGAMGWITDGLFGLFAHDDSRVQALRNWGLNSFNRSGPVKRWLARQAMGQAA
ncbi:FAD-dependent monooxygenase [Hydrogenophaga sp. PBL-H3]|uniref:FAD-dependent monooxygenase n=1 Tax=Hydrogenophaga sp. PBL-H3 TaxID=434010 RepID=UPI00131F5003|nr:FAD-dependent monooxygenase [Hydrogenophaga sp. PBL-H3]QHE77803.1 ubiquinone biosynthesis protein UbiH [Hydrogenophaga sp. PBL-H3]QHE82227.1 ubiquinone biosynthesis protein UbiH [Hydrogenophaga sp. PBL-H3]